MNLVSYGNTSSTWTVITLADLRASLRAVTAYTLAVFAVAALPGYLLAAAAIERPGITYFFTDFGPNTTTLV